MLNLMYKRREESLHGCVCRADAVYSSFTQSRIGRNVFRLLPASALFGSGLDVSLEEAGISVGHIVYKFHNLAFAYVWGV